MKMTILFNLLSIKKGGGQQVAANFVDQISKRADINPVFLVTSGTYLHEKLKNYRSNNVVAIENNFAAQMKFRVFGFGKLFKLYDINLIYTIFGLGLFKKGVISVTGCAYSNLFYPEIDFWKGVSYLTKIKLKLKDQLRLHNILKSDSIVFENEGMLRRCLKLFDFPEDKVKLILPSISEYPSPVVDLEFKNRLNSIDGDKFNILMLTGWHPNKNLRLIPKILASLKKRDVKNVNFVITVDEYHPESLKLIREAEILDVADNIIFFDKVHPHEIPLLVERIDAIMLLSLLESFSNNIIEAWYFNRPLFISDGDWAKAICKDAAIYVSRNNPDDICNKLIHYLSDANTRDYIMKNSREILTNYPSASRKVELQIDYLKKIYNEKRN